MDEKIGPSDFGDLGKYKIKLDGKKALGIAANSLRKLGDKYRKKGQINGAVVEQVITNPETDKDVVASNGFVVETQTDKNSNNNDITKESVDIPAMEPIDSKEEVPALENQESVIPEKNEIEENPEIEMPVIDESPVEEETPILVNPIEEAISTKKNEIGEETPILENPTEKSIAEEQAPCNIEELFAKAEKNIIDILAGVFKELKETVDIAEARTKTAEDMLERMRFSTQEDLRTAFEEGYKKGVEDSKTNVLHNN